MGNFTQECLQGRKVMNLSLTQDVSKWKELNFSHNLILDAEDYWGMERRLSSSIVRNNFPIGAQQRGNILFSNGASYIYEQLFSHLFKFTVNVEKFSANVSQRIKEDNRTLVCIHARHQPYYVRKEIDTKI